MSKSKEPVTTIQLPMSDRDAVKEIANARGLKIKHTPGILAEAWKLLSQEQVAAACERYAARRPRRPQRVE